MADITEQQLMMQDPELMGLQYKRQLANLLTGQAFNQPQGQVISGHYVKPSGLQQALPMINAAIGGLTNANLDTDQQKIAERLRLAKSAAEEKISNLAFGTPDTATELAGPYTGKVPMPVAVKEGTKPDLAAALRQINNPYSYGAGADLKPLIYKQMLPEATVEEKRYKAAIADGSFKGGFNAFLNQMNEKDKASLALDEKRYGLDAARFNLEKSKAEVNPAEAPLRTSFLNQAAPHIQISQAYRKIESAPDTAAGDMSKIFGFMKILDPGSTVREGEYASAENARGVPDTVRAQYNKVQSGQRLTPNQRKEFTQAAGDLVKSQEQQFTEIAKYYTEISGRSKINPDNVIYNPYKDLNLQTTPPKTPKPVANQPAITPQAVVAPAGQFDPKLLQFMTPEQQALFGVKK